MDIQKDELARKRAQKKASKGGSRQNRMKRKPSKDQHTSQDDTTTIPVYFAIVSNTDDTTPQDALELDCECLGTHRENVSMGNGAEWIKCSCGQWVHEEYIESTANDMNGKVTRCSNCIVWLFLCTVHKIDFQ